MRMNEQSVKRVVDTALARQTFTQGHARAILGRVEEGTKVKKKMSAALAFALVLMLLAASAVAAALLSGKSFVKEIMAPLALENKNEQWTHEEIERIIALGKEHGIAIDPDEEARILAMEEGYWKEELMRRFAKVELGFYPSGWSLEDQAWYDQLLDECGLLEEFGRTYFVPGEGELTQAAALQIVYDYVHTHYDPDVDLTDTSVYRRDMTYRAESGTAPIEERVWGIEFTAIDRVHDSYGFSLDYQGNIDEESIYVFHGAGTLDNPGEPHAIFDRFRDMYGSEFDWDMTVWVDFQALLAAAMERTYDASRTPGSLRYVAAQTYAVPDDTMLTRDAAVAAGIAAAEKAMGSPIKERLALSSYAVCLRDGEEIVWKTTVPVGERKYYLVEIDARTGDTKDVYAVQPEGAVFAQSVTLRSVYEQVKQSLPTPPPDGWG